MYPLNFEAIDDEWCIDGEKVKWQDDKIKFKENHYSADMYHQRFYSRSIFEGKEYTMIFGDPQVDGMIWSFVFRNSLRKIIRGDPDGRTRT